MGYSTHFKTKGFTLIEVLVVVAILGILMAFSLSSLTESRMRGRDSARVADIQKITTALGTYFSVCRQYPSTLATTTSNGCLSGTTLGTFLPSIPTDPQGSAYGYGTSGAGNGYDAFIVRAVFERDETDLTSDIDGSSYKNVSLDCSDSPTRYFCLGS